MHSTANRNIVLGVTGGIAAYKSPDLVRRLRERGHSVRVVMTRAACEFITPLTLQAVSGQPVHTELLDTAAEAAMGHIELARWADIVVVAPATADFLAKLAHGLADDLLCALCLATGAPLVVAPAMNRFMWAAPATRANCATLLEREVGMLGPGVGSQACGEEGPGRMLEPETIAQALEPLLARQPDLSGLSILITAGPTREALDPVRYLSNYSSGKMGYALANAAVDAGANVTLVSGPTTLPTPPRVQRVDVESAQEMRDAVIERAGGVQILIAAAAVADYRPAQYSHQKIKKAGPKTSATESVALERTPDILAELANLSSRPFTVGFAAETQDLESNARTKLEGKSLDLIAANRVDGPGVGFDSDENQLDVFWLNGSTRLALKSKRRLATELLTVIAEQYGAQH